MMKTWWLADLKLFNSGIASLLLGHGGWEARICYLCCLIVGLISQWSICSSGKPCSSLNLHPTSSWNLWNWATFKNLFPYLLVGWALLIGPGYTTLG